MPGYLHPLDTHLISVDETLANLPLDLTFEASTFKRSSRFISLFMASSNEFSSYYPFRYAALHQVESISQQRTSE